MNDKQADAAANGIIGLFLFVAILIFATICMWGYPHYRVWSAGMRGEASLRQAESEKKIAIETAKAKLEAAKLEAEAEVERAKGMSKAIEAVGEMSKKYPEYKHQRFIEGFAEALEQGKIDQIIYVPTEANIPIIEAGLRPVK